MKKFKFRLQVVLDMRENELEQRQMEAAKILAALRQQEAKLNDIINLSKLNEKDLDELYNTESLDIPQIEAHRDFGIKLATDIKNQERVIANTRAILERKQEEVREAHKKAEILRKLKEKQEKEYYQEFLRLEVKEIDDITSARFNIG